MKKKLCALFLCCACVLTFGLISPAEAKCSNVGAAIGGVVAGVAIGAIATNALSRPDPPPPPPRMHHPKYKKPCHCRGRAHMTTCCNYAYPAYVNYSWRIR